MPPSLMFTSMPVWLSTRYATPDSLSKTSAYVGSPITCAEGYEMSGSAGLSANDVNVSPELTLRANPVL